MLKLLIQEIGLNIGIVFFSILGDKLTKNLLFRVFA